MVSDTVKVECAFDVVKDKIDVWKDIPSEVVLDGLINKVLVDDTGLSIVIVSTKTKTKVGQM